MSATEIPRDEIFLNFALQEVAAALRTLDEVERLSAVREERAPGVTVREFGSIMAAVRYALHLAGSASRIFWPPKDINKERWAISKERGKRLRALVRLPEEHGLKKRSLRDHIEHLDVRLDAWTEKSPRPFMNVEMVLHGGDADWRRTQALELTLLIYDVPHREVIVLGEVFSLVELKAALEDVRNLISAAFERMYPA